MRKLVAFGDAQIPFQDDRAVDAALAFTKQFAPHVTVVMGDILDCYSLSPFDRDPERKHKLADDLKAAKGFLQRVEAAAPAGSDLVFLEGNHEDRVRRFLWRKAPELASLDELSLQSLLGLDSGRWKYYPYYDPAKTAGTIGHSEGDLLTVHGWLYRSYSGGSARANFDKLGGSGLVGHCHYLGEYRATRRDGLHVWMETGCLCDLSPAYRPFSSWQHGLVAGYLHGPRAEEWDLRTVPIVDGRVLWEGKAL